MLHLVPTVVWGWIRRPAYTSTGSLLGCPTLQQSSQLHHTRMHACMHARTHTHMRTHARTHTHTHTQQGAHRHVTQTCHTDMSHRHVTQTWHTDMSHRYVTKETNTYATPTGMIFTIAVDLNFELYYRTSATWRFVSS